MSDSFLDASRVFDRGVHPTAIVDGAAELGPDVRVGPYAIIGPGVRVGAGTQVGPHVLIERDTQVGESCRIAQGAVLGTDPRTSSTRASTPSWSWETAPSCANTPP